MTEPGASRFLRFSLVLATFIVLAAIGWGVSLGVGIFQASQKKAEQSQAPVQIAPPPPVDDASRRAAAELEAKYAEERAKLEQQLDAAARETADETADEPVRVGGEVTPPVRVQGGPPAYTEIARRARIQGVVILEAVIDRAGRVTSTHVLKSLPMGLDQQAREAVAGWRFKPATRGGQPVVCLYTVTVEFRLP